ncbi:MAG: HAD hydrolase-like protein [Elusimicrobiota bacterium]
MFLNAKVYQHIIFDFDGVLAETNAVRLEGFRLLFKGYPEEEVDQLVKYAEKNGGLSRYEKIKYFFEKICGKEVSDKKLYALAQEYSKLIKQRIIDAAPVKGSIKFLSKYYDNYDFAVVSGSDQEELQDVCKARKINHFFVEILGSPSSKESNLDMLLGKMGWAKKSCLFIGDSINDLDAACLIGIDFIGRNSDLMDWKFVNGITSIDDFTCLDLKNKEDENEKSGNHNGI